MKLLIIEHKVLGKQNEISSRNLLYNTVPWSMIHTVHLKFIEGKGYLKCSYHNKVRFRKLNVS